MWPDSGYTHSMDRIAMGPNAPAVARERAAEYFSGLLDADREALLRLLVSELVSEAVERCGRQRRVLELHLAHPDGRVHVEVRQAGSGTNDLCNEVRRTILDRSATAWGADDQAGGRLWFDLTA